MIHVYIYIHMYINVYVPHDISPIQQLKILRTARRGGKITIQEKCHFQKKKILCREITYEVNNI